LFVEIHFDLFVLSRINTEIKKNEMKTEERNLNVNLLDRDTVEVIFEDRLVRLRLFEV